MDIIPSKSFIQKQNYTFEMAAQSLIDGSRHPFTKTNINHVLQLV